MAFVLPRRRRLTAISATLIAAAGLFVATPAHAQDDADGRDDSSASSDIPKVLTLADAIAFAKTHSPAMRSAQAGVASAEAQTDAAIAGYLPTLSAQGSTTAAYQRLDVITTRGIQQTETQSVKGSVGAHLGWTLWDFGRTSNGVAAGHASTRARELDRKAAEIQLAHDVAAAYLDVLFDGERVTAQKVTVLNHQRGAALAKALVASGMRPPIEEVRAKVQLENAQLQLGVAQAKAAASRVKLASLLTLDPSRDFEVAKPAVLTRVENDDPKRAVATAERERPDVESAKADVEAREAGVDQAKAGYWPTISAAGDANYSSLKYDDGSTTTPRGVTGSLVLSIPIFDFSIPASVSAAKARLAAAEASRDQTAIQVKSNAALAAVSLKSARGLAAQAMHLAQSAGAVLAVMEARYASGLASPLDLVGAQDDEADARAQAIEAERTMAQSTVDLLAATGRLGDLSR